MPNTECLSLLIEQPSLLRTTPPISIYLIIQPHSTPSHSSSPLSPIFHLLSPLVYSHFLSVQRIRLLAGYWWLCLEILRESHQQTLRNVSINPPPPLAHLSCPSTRRFVLQRIPTSFTAIPTNLCVSRLPSLTRIEVSNHQNRAGVYRVLDLQPSPFRLHRCSSEFEFQLPRSHSLVPWPLILFGPFIRLNFFVP